MPYIGRTLGQGTRSRFLYTATAGQTTFSGSDSQSNTLAYADNNGLDCFQNGVLLKGGGADYTATTGTSVVLTTGASVNDVIEILVYDVFAIADHVKKSGDAMTGALTNIDVNGTELILDADGDTSITADTDDQIDIKVGGSDRVTIDSSGRVLIGTDSGDAFNDDSMLRLQRTGDRVFIHFKTDADQVSGILFGDVDDDVECAIEYEPANKALTFSTNNNTEAVRIDDSGRLLVGKTSSSQSTVGGTLEAGSILGIVDGGQCARFNRLSSEGDIIQFRKDGSDIGKIGVGNSALFIVKPSIGGINFASSSSQARIVPCDETGAFEDNIHDIGDGAVRWDDIFATNSSIQTSDQNEKQDIASATTKELNVAKKLSALFKTFRWKDKVTEKGEKARTHTGIIAQEVQSAFSQEGLDASNYGLFTSNTWWEKDKKIYITKEEAPKDATEKTRLGVRYPELFSFIFSSIEARLTALESK